jgi:hypothetical protein
MDIRLIIAILAFLGFALLPVLDQFAKSELRDKGMHSYLVRIARWVNQ